MALSRRMLSAMGLEADKIEQIIEAHTETVTGLKQQNAGAQTQASAFRLLHGIDFPFPALRHLFPPEMVQFFPC